MTTTAPADATARVHRSARAERPRGRRPSVRGALPRAPLYVLLVVLLVVVVYPLVWMVLGSFKTQEEFLNAPSWALPDSFTNFSNYTEAWQGVALYLRNSVAAVLPALALNIVLGTAAGFALEVMVWRGRRATLLVFLAGIMIPSQMIILPLFTAYFRAGLTSTLWPLIITYTVIGMPLTVFMMATYFRAIPREVFEAAALDGAGLVRSFASIGFPMMRNSVLTIALVQFFFIWNDLLIALTFTTRDDLRTVQVGLLNFTGQFGVVQYGPTLAAICINVFIILALYLFLNKQVMRGLTAGSVKG